MDQTNVLNLLMDYFPTAINTGDSIVFISENWRVELREHHNPRFGQYGKSTPVIRVKIHKKALSGEFLPGHYQDFQIDSIGELAGQIERYIQHAVGQNIRESTD